MFDRLQNVLNTTLRFPAERRFLFYALVRAQLRAGVTAGMACRTLAALPELPANLKKIAVAGAQASHDGRAVIDGLADTNMFPPTDIGILQLADKNEQLAEALDTLEARGEESLGFASQVVLPNLYYTVILAVLVLFVWEAQSFLGTLQFTDLSANPAMVLSSRLHLWGPAVGLTAVGLTAVIWWGKSAWTGRARQALLFFDMEGRYQIGIVFTDIAEMLTRHGASHTEILDALESALGHSHFIGHYARKARHSVIQQGEAWETAISGGLLTREHADLLAGLVPGGRRDLYPQAYRTLGAIQRRLLKTAYRSVAGILRLILLLTIVYLFVTLTEGMYSLFDMVGQ